MWQFSLLASHEQAEICYTAPATEQPFCCWGLEGTFFAHNSSRSLGHTSYTRDKARCPGSAAIISCPCPFLTIASTVLPGPGSQGPFSCCQFLLPDTLLCPGKAVPCPWAAGGGLPPGGSKPRINTYSQSHNPVPSPWFGGGRASSHPNPSLPGACA